MVEHLIDLDRYFIKDPQNNPVFLADLATVKSKMNANQKLVFIMDTHYIDWAHTDFGGISKEELKEKEGKLILETTNTSDIMILLDDGGKQLTSPKLADYVQKLLNRGAQQIVFVIGGAFGFSDAVRSRSNSSWSLSKLTFPHHLVRTIFLEQLYRAFTILNGERYHND